MTTSSSTAAFVPATGDLVTVTFAEGGTTLLTRHGRFDGVMPVEVLRDGDRFVTVLGTPRAPHPDSKPWNCISAVWGSFTGRFSVTQTETYTVGVSRVLFDLDDARWSITPITAEGEAYIAETEPMSDRAERLLARFASFDPEAAEALGTVIGRLKDEARSDGYSEGRGYDSY